MSEFLNLDDVVSTDQNVPGINRPTFQVQEALAVLAKHYGEIPVLGDGTPCRVLRPGNQWRAGKMRVRFEFIPDNNP